jgi:hypothetical protein
LCAGHNQGSLISLAGDQGKHALQIGQFHQCHLARTRLQTDRFGYFDELTRRKFGLSQVMVLYQPFGQGLNTMVLGNGCQTLKGRVLGH